MYDASAVYECVKASTAWMSYDIRIPKNYEQCDFLLILKPQPAWKA